MSIASEITRLQQAKADIKAAIETKGVTVGDGTIDTYAAKVLQIPTNASHVYKTPNFYIHPNSSAPDFIPYSIAELQADIDATDISGMQNAPNITVANNSLIDINTALTFTHWNNLPILKYVNGMFSPPLYATGAQAQYLKKLDLRALDLSHVIQYHKMFYHADVLEEIDMSTWSLSSNASIFQYMFSYCKKLKVLNLPTTVFNFTVSCNATSMFQYTGSDLTETDNVVYDLSCLANIASSASSTNLQYMFSFLGPVTLLGLDTWIACQNPNSNSVLTLQNMFSKAKLKTINMPNFAPKQADISYMCSECTNLISFSMPNIVVKKNTSMSRMFYKCTSLTSVDLSGLQNSEYVNDYSSMFNQCSSLVNLDLSMLKRRTNGSFSGINNMFNECTSLQHLDMREFHFNGVTSFINAFKSVPNDCEIIVKDDTEKAWFTTNWANLTNVKTVAEL